MNLDPPWEIIGSMSQGNTKRRLIRETALFAVLLFVGLVAVPIGVFWIGPQLLGDFGGTGFSEFFGAINDRLLAGELPAWMLVLSPYLGIQCLRLAVAAWRAGGKPARPHRAPQP